MKFSRTILLFVLSFFIVGIFAVNYNPAAMPMHETVIPFGQDTNLT